MDIDKLAHKALKDDNVKKRIVGIFGDIILDEEGNIDRKKLGQIVFNDKDLKVTVYDITWNYMDNCIRTYKNDCVILDWYNIVNKRYWDIATIRVLVERDYFERRADVIKRDNISEEYFDLREANSVQYDDFVVDYKINISDLDKIEELVNLFD